METTATQTGSEVVVDLGAVRDNVAAVRATVGAAEVMAVVKADAYGHGALPAARAALDGGATSLGVATVAEALALRAGGIEAPVLAWLLIPGDDLTVAVAADVELSVAAPWSLAAVVAAARALGRPARVHLELDTGMSRGGVADPDRPAMLAELSRAVAEGAVRLVGTWAHLASSDVPADPANARQLAAFADAVVELRGAGLDPGRLHHANSAAALLLPGSRFDLVRVGLACWGLSPAPQLATSTELGLRPAMTLRSRLAHVRRVPAGTGVSYGLTWSTPRATTLGLVPLGYGDGIPRHASRPSPAGTAGGSVLVAGARRPVTGRICMDQFVVDLGGEEPEVGSEVVVFGDGHDGAPTAQDWAEAAGTISYEIVTRIAGPRVPRRHRW
ncbi:alanine racemase [Kineococcus gynurae]|uniref:Alanine racemase n=1 Tax=Kineococcus gynurae TaxID=452979 RepID=A0ABV5LTC0_9ACTN